MTKATLTAALLLLALGMGMAQQEYCIPDRFSQTPFFEEADIASTEGVLFGVAPRWPAEVQDSLRMDFYYPEPGVDPLAKRPFILLIHGGAYFGGNRADMRPWAIEMARRGFVAATMSYRLGWDCPPSAGLFVCLICANEAEKLKVAAYRAIQDARAAMRFAVANADAFGIDTGALFTGGTSAGAIAAIHAAYLSQADADAFCPACVPAVGPLDSGVNDLTNAFQIRGVVNNCGAVINPDILTPQQDIPVISFHDDGDCIVPSAFGHALGCFGCTAFLTGHGSQVIHSRLTEQEGCSMLNLRLNNGGHCSFPLATVVGRSTCFLKRLLCGECPNESSNALTGVDDCTGLGVTSAHVGAAGPAFTLFPNPTTGHLTLRLGTEGRGVAEVWIHNTLGQLRHRHQWAGQPTTELSLHGLPTGTYFVTVVADGRTSVGKIVKR